MSIKEAHKKYYNRKQLEEITNLSNELCVNINQAKRIYCKLQEEKNLTIKKTKEQDRKAWQDMFHKERLKLFTQIQSRDGIIFNLKEKLKQQKEQILKDIENIEIPYARISVFGIKDFIIEELKKTRR